MTLGCGALVLVNLDPALGHEQQGMRPCIVVSDPSVISKQRFPLIRVVPVTGTAADGLLYPSLEPGPKGLVNRSLALIDQLRSIDKRRIRRLLGELPASEINAIDEGLTLFLGLDNRARTPIQ